MADHGTYQNPLIARYAGREMAALWSDQRKFSTWRQLWVALAEAEQSLGLEIGDGQIEALRRSVDAIDFDKANAYEKKLRHDVMAHVHTLGDAAPEARAIIHLGATSCYVTDNTDLILIRDALRLVRQGLIGTIDALGTFAERWKDLPCLGYTHFQPAQLVTVGKRATLWAHDLVLDLEEIDHRLASLKFLGVKGTTGTQASFLALFDGDHARVRALDERVARAFDFAETYPVSGQTYSRKVDAQVVAAARRVRRGAHRSAPTCDYWPTNASWKSRSKPTRSARRRWPTSGTRCGPNGSAPWRGSRWASRRCSRRRPPRSGWSGRWMTAPSEGWSSRRPSWPPTRCWACT
ncbi:MAG: lyase family protein [Isosphaeraceae bacterium]